MRRRPGKCGVKDPFLGRLCTHVRQHLVQVGRPGAREDHGACGHGERSAQVARHVDQAGSLACGLGAHCPEACGGRCRERDSHADARQREPQPESDVAGGEVVAPSAPQPIAISTSPAAIGQRNPSRSHRRPLTSEQRRPLRRTATAPRWPHRRVVERDRSLCVDVEEEEDAHHLHRVGAVPATAEQCRVPEQPKMEHRVRPAARTESARREPPAECERASVGADVHPHPGPCCMASTKANRPVARSAAPAIEVRPLGGPGQPAQERQCRKANPAPTMTVIHQTQRQPMRSVIAPPIRGPMAKPRPPTAPQIPSAKPWRSGG